MEGNDSLGVNGLESLRELLRPLKTPWKYRGRRDVALPPKPRKLVAAMWWSSKATHSRHKTRLRDTLSVPWRCSYTRSTKGLAWNLAHFALHEFRLHNSSIFTLVYRVHLLQHTDQRICEHIFACTKHAEPKTPILPAVVDSTRGGYQVLGISINLFVRDTSSTLAAKTWNVR